MPFIKVVKNKAYFKRYQTRFRRRREGKTDYRARLRLVTQDKNKYNSPKYRLVVRFTNKDIVCQVAYSRIDGDHILAAAYSHELPRYGVPLGLTNYAAAYATGLLLARRTLQKLKLDTLYQGVDKVTGEDYNVEQAKEEGPRPFKALLDVGLVRTTTGCRVFAAMKGMTDGGVNVPHSETRFVGFKEGKGLDAAVLRKYIFGGHVADYMKKLLKEDAEAYARQFSRYKAAGITPDKLEKMYAEAHKKIRADPSFVKKERKDFAKKSFAKRRLTLAERKNNAMQKKIRLGYPVAK